MQYTRMMTSCHLPHGWCTLLLVAALLLAGCGNAEESSEEEGYQVGDPIDDPEIAAVVTSEFGADTLHTNTFQSQVMQGAQPPNQVIEAFVARHVISGEADRLDLQVDEAEVDQRMEALRARFEDDEEYQAALESEGMTEDSLRETMVEMLRMQEMEQQLASTAEEPSEDEVEAYRQEQSQQVGARHILFRVSQDASEAERDSVRAQAVAVLDSIQAGADFAELAQRHSDDGTAEQGGDLGYIRHGQTVPPFDEAVFALADSGDVTSEPVETRFGYHIIQKTGEREADAMPSEQARQMMLQQRRMDAVQSELDRLMAKATVRVNSDVTGVTLDEES